VFHAIKREKRNKVGRSQDRAASTCLPLASPEASFVYKENREEKMFA
jgi:hypothetical protein